GAPARVPLRAEPRAALPRRPLSLATRPRTAQGPRDRAAPRPLTLQRGDEARGVVGHHAIRAHCEQAAGFFGVVDRPEVDAHAELVEAIDGALRIEANTVRATRYL